MYNIPLIAGNSRSIKYQSVTIFMYVTISSQAHYGKVQRLVERRRLK